MKKTLVLLLSLVLVVSTFAGCSSKDATATEGSASTETAKTLDLAFATGGTSGTYYPLGGAIANVWNDKIAGINVTIQPAGASVENINRVSSGEVD